MEGIMRLSIHMPVVATKMLAGLAVNGLKRNKPAVPLIPSSVRAMEGITAINQKNRAERQNN